MSQVHSPLGTMNDVQGLDIFLQVTENLSDQPQEVDPVNSLQAEKLASMICFPDFLSKSQLGPQSITSRLIDLPLFVQLITDPHPNLCLSAAYPQVQLPHDFPHAVSLSQKDVKQYTWSAGMSLQAVCELIARSKVAKTKALIINIVNTPKQWFLLRRFNEERQCAQSFVSGQQQPQPPPQPPQPIPQPPIPPQPIPPPKPPIWVPDIKGLVSKGLEQWGMMFGLPHI